MVYWVVGYLSLGFQPRRRMANATSRVVLLTADSIYSRSFLEAFRCSSNVEVAGVVLSTAYLKRGVGGLTGLCQFIRRVGVTYAFYQALVCWVLPWIKGKANYASPVLETNDINSVESVAWIRERKPDFLLSYHFNQKILESVIGIPKRAALNFHPSYLPDWRGVDPVLFALQNQSAVLGGSVHYVSPQIDEGDILLREKIGIEHVAGLIKTNEALFMLGGRMAGEVIGDFDRFEQRRLCQTDLGPGHYDGWNAVGELGLKGLWKALWATPRKAS